MLSQLKQARIQAGYTTKEVAEKLHLKEQYLIALEENNFSKIDVGMVYVNGYLKIYAKYLGVELEDQNTVSGELDDLENKILPETKNSNYLIIFTSIIMLIITTFCYNSISQTEINNISAVSVIEEEKPMTIDSTALTER